MSTAPNPHRATPIHDPGQVVQDTELEQLRALLLGKDYEELLEIKRRLQDPISFSQFVADVLPGAVAISAAQDNRFTKAILQNVEDALLISVKNNPRPLVEALFPVIGPAIRKAIAETLADLLKTINQLVEHSLSARSLKWRFDAWRTGTSYAEIVLRNTLVYQVEQVFLIHRDSGLLLNHVTSNTAITKDPDMVSAMLTAIQDFISDSFEVDELENLQEMRFGDLTVLIEPGPRAILAVAIRGNPPEELRRTLAENLEHIHLIHSDTLKRFEGDSTDFIKTSPNLENCLLSQAHEKSGRRTSPITWLLILGILALLGYWLYGLYDTQRRWNTALQSLYAEPGLVVISGGRTQGHYVVRGLRDELARDPRQVVGDELADELGIEWRWQPYIALQPELTLKRARQLLQPPVGIDLRIDGSTLILSGEAGEDWLTAIKDRVPMIPGVQAVNTDGVLLEDRHIRLYEQRRRELESFNLLFEYGAFGIDTAQTDAIDALAIDIRALQKAAETMPGLLKISVIGHSDSQGSVQSQNRIALARAEAVMQALAEHGLEPALFSVIGVGATRPVHDEQTADDESLNRRVTFEATLIEDSLIDGDPAK